MKAALYKEYSNLSVYSIDAEGLLALKLTSARAGSKDLQDSITLMRHLNIKTEEELFDIVEKCASPNQLTPRSHYFIKEAFSQYMQEKEVTRPAPMSLRDWQSQIAQEQEKAKDNSQPGDRTKSSQSRDNR